MLKIRKPSNFIIKYINNSLTQNDCNKLNDKDKDKILLCRHFLKTNQKDIPDYIENFYKKNLISNMLLLDYKKTLSKTLKDLNIKFLFYKGAYLLEDIYENIGYRYLGDIDILVNEKDLTKLEEVFFNHKKKIRDLAKNKFFHETYIMTKHKEQRINLDIHKNIIAFDKYPVNPDVFLKENRPEHHLIILLIEFNSEFFFEEKRLLDIVMLIDKKDIDWLYFYDLTEKFKLNRVVFTSLSYINYFLNKNYPLNNKKALPHRLFLTFDNKRWNQFFLFFYNFDNIKEYLFFLKKRLKYSYENKEIYTEIKKFWTKYH